MIKNTKIYHEYGDEIDFYYTMTFHLLVISDLLSAPVLVSNIDIANVNTSRNIPRQIKDIPARAPTNMRGRRPALD
jgi:hypothetical protein